MTSSRRIIIAASIGCAVLLAALAYIRSGVTYCSNVGFGSACLTLYPGTFSYSNDSDIGYINRAAGFTQRSEQALQLSPLDWLTADPAPPVLSERLLRMRCGEREYLVSEHELASFRSWQRDYLAAFDATMQPFLMRVGDADRRHGECAAPDRAST